MSPRPLGPGETVEVALRQSIDRCQVIAFLAGKAEADLTDEVLSGFEDLFKELALTLRIIKHALPSDALNVDLPVLEDAE